MPDDRFKAAYEAAMDDVAKAQAFVTDKKRVANTIAGVYGVPIPFEDADAPAAVVAKPAIKPDQFANYSAPSEAARAFLTMRREAVDLETILDGLRRGGFAFATSKNEQAGGLAKALGKDRLVRRLDSGAYGLWEWYPKAKRDREKRSGDNGDKDEADTNAVDLTESTPTPESPISKPTE